ncbi:MAG: DUF5686 and carboxypeptidase regulatory-like domain-containing protein [Bacteroidetes bacterium]|nr:DUF5686 and carboxypeptidase regulatory-like domain-containing protein [Bacteroidota bacterium]
MKLLSTLFFLSIVYISSATVVTGKITDNKKNALSHASILIKGTTKGTTANENGIYFLSLDEGDYTVVFQHVGFKTTEKSISIKKQILQLDVEMIEQNYTMEGIVLKPGGEDPAYEIIRNAIKTREEHLYEIKKFETDVYVKGQIQLRDFPDKFFGSKVDFEDGDTSKKKMIFLSETVAKYYVNGKRDRKIDVISTRVSGAQNGFGMASPQIISFYNNIINVGEGLNPRGFISPISDNALHYYKYKFMGSFFENGKEISRIKVIPKRAYEPLFNGYINIIENEWRIHSTNLILLKQQQLQLLDTLSVQQIYTSNKNNWVIKQQVLHLTGKIFKFDFFGNIVQVYDNFNTNPNFSKGFFDNTILKFADSSNKKTKAYWDSVRPIPLLEAEAKDYVKKDSLEQAHKDPKYLDSIDKKNNKLNISGLIFRGQSFNNEKKKSNFYIEPLLTSLLQFNTVEGLVANVNIHYNKEYANKSRIAINPILRYGFSNKHFNPSINTYIDFRKKYLTTLNVKFGSTVFQFDKNDPIDVFDNTLSTLRWQNNYMKIYEAKFFKADFTKGLNNGLTLQTSVQYQDRIPLENTTNYSWRTFDNKTFTPNYPAPLQQIVAHKAFSINANLTWRPGARYIEFPDRKINIGSRYPTFNFSFTQGIPSVLGSDVDYSKWAFTVNDNLNLKLGGKINYKLRAAGFAHNTAISVIDMNHVLGNQISSASEYLNSFQLMPYYMFSNTSRLYTEAHIEYHLNGLLTNKIPLFKKLNWFFVVGTNVLYNNDEKAGYYEALIGVENILKVFRIDFVKAFTSNKTSDNFGIKFSFPMFGKNRP